MDRLGHLPLLWASISAAFWLTPTAGPQPAPASPPSPAPKLTLVPPRYVFIRGEKLQLTCTPPERWRAVEFLFYKTTPGGKWALQMQQPEDTWEVSTAHLEPWNTFFCAYKEKNNAGAPVWSARSDYRMITITELQPAALSLDPKYPAYIQGERVTLTCSAPEEVEVAGYIFYKEQRNQTLEELPITGQGPYETFKVDQNTAGKYSCIYWTLHSKWEIRSPHSGLVSVAVTKHLRPPILSVSPKREVYRSGECINFTCSVSDSRPASKIMFHKDSRRLPDTHRLSSSTDRNTYTLCLSPRDGGRYSCTYQVVESGREIPSTKSDTTYISVMVTVPESSAAVLAAHTYESKAGVTRSPAYPTSSPLQATSSQPVMEESSPSTKPDKPSTSLPSSSQPALHDRASGSTTFQDSSEPFTSSGDPRSASQPTAASEAENGNDPLPIEFQPAALSLDPKYPVYIQGERVTLTCSAPEEVEVAGYIFYKEQRNQTLEELPITGQGPYETFKVDQNTAGKYSCVYWTLHSKWEIRSPHSGLVSVAVTKRPRPPILSVSPKREVYRSGKCINFTCSVSDSRPASKIMFHKDSRRLPDTHRLSSSTDRNTYTLCLSPRDGGRYSCTYQVVESGREIRSTKSNTTYISVMGHAPSFVRHLAVAGAFFVINSLVFIISVQYW